MKIRLDLYDDLALNKILYFSVLNIFCESVVQIENKYYPQIHINGCEYECEYKFLKTFYKPKSDMFDFHFSYTFLGSFSKNFYETQSRLFDSHFSYTFFGSFLKTLYQTKTQNLLHL